MYIADHRKCLSQTVTSFLKQTLFLSQTQIVNITQTLVVLCLHAFSTNNKLLMFSGNLMLRQIQKMKIIKNKNKGCK